MTKKIIENKELPNFILNQFRTTYNQTEWFVSFHDAVKDLTDEQAKQKTSENLPTIFEIVTHLSYWNERHLKSIRKESFNTALKDNEETFSKTTATTWPDLYKKADTVFSEWLTELGSAVNEENHDFRTIGNITAHNAYHIGQIVFLRKLQNSWNAANGVK